MVVIYRQASDGPPADSAGAALCLHKRPVLERCNPILALTLSRLASRVTLPVLLTHGREIVLAILALLGAVSLRVGPVPSLEPLLIGLRLCFIPGARPAA